MTNRTAPEGLEAYTAIRIWRSMPHEERLKAAAAIWEPDMAKPEEVAAALAALASARKSRIQSIREAPKARRASWLAGMVVLPDGVASALLYSYHMAHKVPMMCRFLDLIGIQHESGRITEEFEPPTGEALASGVDSLLEERERKEVAVYLQTLVHQDPETWGTLVKVIEERQLA